MHERTSARDVGAKGLVLLYVNASRNFPRFRHIRAPAEAGAVCGLRMRSREMSHVSGRSGDSAQRHRQSTHLSRQRSGNHRIGPPRHLDVGSCASTMAKRQKSGTAHGGQRQRLADSRRRDCGIVRCLSTVTAPRGPASREHSRALSARALSRRRAVPPALAIGTRRHPRVNRRWRPSFVTDM